MTRALPTVGLARSDRAGRTVCLALRRVNVIVAHHRPLNLVSLPNKVLTSPGLSRLSVALDRMSYNHADQDVREPPAG